MISLIFFVVVSFSVAALGSIFTNQSLKTWYTTIKKPSWNPPNWIFAPVWTTLYLMMAVAGWLVWEKQSPQVFSLPLILFFIQLILNGFWSVIFFGMQKMGLAVAEVILLWIFILMTIISFWELVPLAGALLIPYLLWVSFAFFLNLTIWRLNRYPKSF